MKIRYCYYFCFGKVSLHATILCKKYWTSIIKAHTRKQVFFAWNEGIQIRTNFSLHACTCKYFLREWILKVLRRGGDCNFLIVFCQHLQTTKSGLHILLSGAHFATFASVARLRRCQIPKYTSKVSKMIIWKIQYFGVQARSRARHPNHQELA